MPNLPNEAMAGSIRNAKQDNIFSYNLGGVVLTHFNFGHSDIKNITGYADLCCTGDVAKERKFSSNDLKHDVCKY